ncbi:hypothetical protein [Synechococcus sp. PCC 6312]|uniref:hypothetical protein n=1 Tax=Synechococcus sp. (strain ATCC 27167 / PCC 6312) TaxID=195253 RepID=UPI00029F4AD5|nr:hypothetical protein [Synechococcus sp. PCC 6312]AFY62022.1 hypothetical protein Syn6312_2963 [Synechococcus sp. PCC 6312]
MLQEDIKKELDNLNDGQLKQIADFIALVELHAKQMILPQQLWQRATSSDRAKEFREWVSQLPKGNPSLNETAFNRGSIYE